MMMTEKLSDSIVRCKNWGYTMKKYIYAMSSKRSELGAWIEDHTFPVMCAIAQLYLFEGVQDRKHWRNEVWSKFNRMKLLKKRNKLPSSEFILENSWGANCKYVKSAVKWAVDHDKSLTPRSNVDVDELYDIMEIYFFWLSHKLSSDIYLDSDDVYAQLDKLGLSE